MALSSESPSGTSNTEIYLTHIGAWCNLPLENEHVTFLHLSDASSTSTYHRSTRSSASIKSRNPKSKPSSIVSKANMQLAPAETLRNTILEPRQVHSQQVSNDFAASPSLHIEDDKTTYNSKSEKSLDAYDYRHAAHSTIMQEWLDGAHEEGPFVLVEGT